MPLYSIDQEVARNIGKELGDPNDKPVDVDAELKLVKDQGGSKKLKADGDV